MINSFNFEVGNIRADLSAEGVGRLIRLLELEVSIYTGHRQWWAEDLVTGKCLLLDEDCLGSLVFTEIEALVLAPTLGSLAVGRDHDTT